MLVDKLWTVMRGTKINDKGSLKFPLHVLVVACRILTWRPADVMSSESAQSGVEYPLLALRYLDGLLAAQVLPQQPAAGSGIFIALRFAPKQSSRVHRAAANCVVGHYLRERLDGFSLFPRESNLVYHLSGGGNLSI